MPQGPAELQERFGDDGNAYGQLRILGYRFNRGYMGMPPGRTRITNAEMDAIDYLILEWDYGWISGTLPLLADHYTGSDRHVNDLMFGSQFRVDGFGYFECTFPPSLHVAMSPIKSDANTISNFIDEMKRKLYALLRLR